MKMLIGGREVDASNGVTYQNIEPATGDVIDTVPAATLKDVEEAISNAVKGQKEWAAIPFHKRMEKKVPAFRLKFISLLCKCRF